MATKAFNGDEILLQRVKDLVAKHGINLIVETGTYHGDTTLELSKMVPLVATIESNIEYYKIAAPILDTATNLVRQIIGDSGKIMPSLLTQCLADKILFFLDAHWNAYNPLIDELKSIAAAKIQPVILIHDFFVPGKSTVPGGPWGFDTYDGQDYNWEWVAPHVEAIYPNGFVKSYNDDYQAFRGCLILEPKI